MISIPSHQVPTKGAQALVDGLCLLQPVSAGLGPAQPLAASQIDQVQDTCSSNIVWQNTLLSLLLPARPVHPQDAHSSSCSACCIGMCGGAVRAAWLGQLCLGLLSPSQLLHRFSVRVHGWWCQAHRATRHSIDGCCVAHCVGCNAGRLQLLLHVHETCWMSCCNTSRCCQEPTRLPQQLLLCMQGLLDTLVEPQQCSLCTCCPVAGLAPAMVSMKAMWERELRSFSAVAPTARCRVARAIRSATRPGHLTSTASRKETLVQPLSSCDTCRAGRNHARLPTRQQDIWQPHFRTLQEFDEGAAWDTCEPEAGRLSWALICHRPCQGGCRQLPCRAMGQGSPCQSTA